MNDYPKNLKIGHSEAAINCRHAGRAVEEISFFDTPIEINGYLEGKKIQIKLTGKRYLPADELVDQFVWDWGYRIFKDGTLILL